MISSRGATIKSIINSCAREVATADAEMQLAQRRAWTDFNNGFPLAAGLDHLEYLGVTEVKLTFTLEPVRPGWWTRAKACLLRKQPEKSFRLSSAAPEGPGHFLLTISIGRGRKGKTIVCTEPDLREIGDAHVADFTS